MAEQARSEMGVETLDAVADRGYYEGEEIKACEDGGITVTLPRPQTSGAKAAGRFGKQDFVYVAAEDVYRCPAGERLTYRFTNEENGKKLRRYWTIACQTCALKARCTTGPERRIRRWEHEAVLVDGEAVACGDDGMASFDALRHRRQDSRVFLYAFDLIELNGDDMRGTPIEQRKADLARLLVLTGPGLRLNDWIDDVDGATVFEHACGLGLEGIVSKRKGSRYQSGRSPQWLKSKNPNHPAATRNLEDWYG